MQTKLESEPDNAILPDPINGYTASAMATTDRLQNLLHLAMASLRYGQFTTDFLSQLKELDQTLVESDLNNQNEYLILKAQCILSEGYYHLGHIDDARRVVDKGPLIYSQLDLTDLSTYDQRRLARERVRYVIDYAQAFLYSNHHYEETISLVEECLKFVQNHLVRPEDFPCNGTQAQIYQLLARAYRQSGLDGIPLFLQAIDYHYRRLEQKKHQSQSHPDRVRNELVFASYRSGLCLGLGIAWVQYTKGKLTQASQYLIPARVMLALSNDDLSKAYLDLVFVSILRCQAGSDKEKLETARNLAEISLEVFLRFDHPRYIPRCRYELSLIDLANGQLARAKQQIAEVAAIAAKTEDWRWLCNALVVQSRIHRKEEHFTDAAEVAEQALRIADKNNMKLAEIDARIARAEARIKLKHYQQARRDLERALAMNKDLGVRGMRERYNPKIEAMAQLNLARAYALEGNVGKARACYGSFKPFEVEDTRIHEFAKIVEREINTAAKDFHIAAGDRDNLDYKVQSEQLKQFLLSQAMQLTDDKTEMARLLGITRPTLYQWLNESDSSK